MLILNDVQPGPREREPLALITEVLQEAEYDPSESVSLAAGVARTWGWFLQDVSGQVLYLFLPSRHVPLTVVGWGFVGLDMGHHTEDGSGSWDSSQGV